MRAGALALLLLAAGCSLYVVERERFVDGAPLVEPGRLAGRTKPEVLAVLGAPREVLAAPSGDVFVYRVRRTDVSRVNVNTGLYLPLAVPLYSSTDGVRVDDLLRVSFDAAGRVRDASLRRVR